jgi:CRP-like cAMP-binding protein
LTNVKFFTELDPDSQRKCITHMIYKEYAAGEFVFHQGEEGTRFYVVLSGSVAVLKVARRKDGKSEYTQLSVLKAGSGFGELALINDQLRAASILCREPTYLAVLERDEYKRILGRIDDAKLEAKVQLLQRHPAFANWGKAALQRVSYFFTEQSCKRKQEVFRAGQDCAYVYFIKAGEFRLTTDALQTGKHAKWSLLQAPRQQREVTLVSAGEVLGDIEAIEGQPYQYTCSCYSTQGEIMQITTEDFLKRLLNEQSAESFKRLNSVKAKVRKERLQKAASIASFNAPKQALSQRNNHSEEFTMVESPRNAINTARKQLTSALTQRWGFPINETLLASLKPQKRPFPSSQDSMWTSDLHTSTSQCSVSPTSWLGLMEHKYFPKGKRALVLFHQMKEPENTLKQRYPCSPRLDRKRSPRELQ